MLLAAGAALQTAKRRSEDRVQSNSQNRTNLRYSTEVVRIRFGGSTEVVRIRDDDEDMFEDDNYLVNLAESETENIEETGDPDKADEWEHLDGSVGENIQYSGSLREDMRCENCDTQVGYIIPHLKRESKCRDHYMRIYLPSNSGDIDNDMRTLASFLKRKKKAENQKLRRLNKEYRDNEHTKRTESRHLKRTDKETINREYFKSIENIMSISCASCHAYVSPNAIKMVQIEMVESPRCKWCTMMQEEVNRWAKLGDINGEDNEEYAEWAQNNFSLANKLCSVRRKITDHVKDIGIMIYNDEKRHIVTYPVTSGAEGKVSIEEDIRGVKYNDPTVLMIDSSLEEYSMDMVSREETDLACRMLHTDMTHLLNVMFKDRQSMMRYAESHRRNRNSEIKTGVVNDGEGLVLKDLTSITGCFEGIKGSKDQMMKQRNETMFRQAQNGTTNLKFTYTVFSGYQAIHSDEVMAMTLLRTRGHKFASMERRCDNRELVKEYRLCCSDKCDPFSCAMSFHPTPGEKINDTDIDPLTICRYISEKITIFIGKSVVPVSQDHDLFLLFDRPSEDGDSGFTLCGHIWLDELKSFNESGEEIVEEEDLIPDALKIENLKHLLGDGGGEIKVIQKLLQWPEQLYASEEKNITDATASRLIDGVGKSMREVSLFEFIFNCGRQVTLRWSSQPVKYINTTDPRKGVATFREFNGDTDDLEFAHYDRSSKKWWVEVDSIEKDYRERPVVMDCLPILQIGVHYRSLEKSNLIYNEKVQELKRTGGVESSTEQFVPLVTNQDRFPDAPRFLPKYILIQGGKILVLKKKPNVVKFKDAAGHLTPLILCEPWRLSQEMDDFENNIELCKLASLRFKKILPLSTVYYPEMT